MKFSKEEKLRMLSELIKVAAADGEHRDEEYDFLHTVTQLLKIEPMEMEKLFTHASKHPMPADEMKRIYIFHQLVLMVIADGEVSYDETKILKDLTLKLGLPPQAINEVINRLDDYMEHGVPVKEFIQIFQVHHN